MSNNGFLPELLAPAGNPEKLRTCLLYGADAIYLGGRTGNLRAACEGFSTEDLEGAVITADNCGSRIYYCLNSLARQSDLAALPAHIEAAAACGVHGFIIADPGVLRLARQYAPHVPIHLSTQANTSNASAAAFWADQGVSRVNLARELSARDVHAIRKALPDMELEVFVHGAMCLAVSGQCLLSAWLNDRSGNQGRCTQPCRFAYRALGVEAPAEGWSESGYPAGHPPGTLLVDEQTRPGRVMWRVTGEDKHSSFWAPQDLCLMPWLSWFGDNRIDALKIEGRMKSAGWLAHVVDAYRSALNRWSGKKQATASGGLQNCMLELLYPATRPLGSGFFLHGRRRNLTEELLKRSSLHSRRNRSGESLLPELGRAVLARILEPAGLGVWKVEVHGNWNRRMDVELVLPGMRRPVLVGGSYGLENQRGELADMVGNGVTGMLYSDMPGIEPGIFIRSGG